MEVWDYFEQREREWLRLSLAPDPDFPPSFIAFAGSGDTRGRLFARLILSDRAMISVAEVVVINGDRPHRDEYAYYLIVDGIEVESRDLDGVHGYHGHGPNHARKPAKRVTFKAFVELAWKIVSDLPEPELEYEA